MTFQRFNLTGKVALVTGGAGLLGKQHTEALLESGAFVYVADIDDSAAKAFCNGLGGRAAQLHLNVADAENVQGCLETVLLEKGAIDILVNNAAIDPKVDADSILETSRLENFSLEQWQFQLDVGLTGAFLCSKYFGVGWPLITVALF